MLIFVIAQSMSFGQIDGASENLKIVFCAIKNLSIPLHRAHRVLLGTRIGALEHITERIGAGITRIRC
jgi:hypothetical protein